MDARVAAVRVLARVLGEGRSLSEALEPMLPRLGSQDQALLRELSYGVLRWYGRLQAVADQLLSRPFRARDQDVRLLVLVGIYQCLELRIPSHAAVASAVEATRALKKPWASGLVNAVLRRLLREREALLARAEASEADRYSHPQWMLDHFRHAWPEHWQALLEANNARAPMTLRVNRLRISAGDYAARLRAEGLECETMTWAPEALVLASPLPVEKLPGFDAGLVAVQDLAAQQAAALLDVPAGARVLDACAAPGGKACHLLERYPGLGELVAVDIEPQRLARVKENLRRLGHRATVLAGDAGDPSGWWDGRPFDRILLDAPCSGTGVIRRHPDIKWLRRAADIPALAAAQRRLLEGLWPLLGRGGKLLYATCSVFPEENERLLAAFLEFHPDARPEPVEAPWGLRRPLGRQILTGEQDMDGFYYGCLSKT